MAHGAAEVGGNASGLLRGAGRGEGRRQEGNRESVSRPRACACVRAPCQRLGGRDPSPTVTLTCTWARRACTGAVRPTAAQRAWRGLARGSTRTLPGAHSMAARSWSSRASQPLPPSVRRAVRQRTVERSGERGPCARVCVRAQRAEGEGGGAEGEGREVKPNARGRTCALPCPPKTHSVVTSQCRRARPAQVQEVSAEVASGQKPRPQGVC